MQEKSAPAGMTSSLLSFPASMKKAFLPAVLCATLLAMAGCATESSRVVESPKVTSHGTAYQGQKAPISVGKFDNKSSFQNGVFQDGEDRLGNQSRTILVAHLGAEAAFATRGNFNNDIGVPLTLLRLSDAHRMGVVEMGMNHPGEIAGLAAMTLPSVALVLNAQREHQEFMDGPEATARENGTVFDALAAGGVAVFPGDDPCTPIWQALAQGHRVLNFGLVADEASLQADAPSMVEAGTPHLFVAAARDARPEHFRARLGETLVDIRLNIPLFAAAMDPVRVLDLFMSSAGNRPLDAAESALLADAWESALAASNREARS